MDSRQSLKLLLTLGAAVLWPLAASAQDADPRLIVLSCAGCHGPDGRSPGPVPSLNGRNAASLAEALRRYRADEPPSTVMGRIARGYSDAEIDAAARDIAAAWK